MNFEKKLIVLTGKDGKGTALVERNGMGVFLLLNVFSLPDLKTGEYAVGVKTGTTVLSRDLGSLGRIRTRIELPDGDYSAVHLVIFTTANSEAVLYGTAAKRRMWEGNLMDGLRRSKVDEKTLSTTKASTPPQEFAYSERKIEDYFLDILPGGPYADGAVAQTNYFAFSQASNADAEEEKPYRPILADEEEPVQREKPLRAAEEERAPSEQNAERREEKPAPLRLPSEMERAYLSKRFPSSRLTEELISDTEAIAATVMEAQQEAKTPYYAEQSTPPRSESFVFFDAEEEQDATDIFGEQNKAEKTDDAPRFVKKAADYTAEAAVAAVKTSADFYTRVKPQIERLFKNGQPFPPLESLLPNTKWVRVDYDGRGRYYLVGLIGDAPDYLAYGVPGSYASRPLEGADFIPEKEDAPTGNGYWVLFQSARTGEEINKA
ncbi:MAG: hypothetical protein K2M95_05140 [Clostridiales bacterium]|nr:hypothetical protein [Clostridiales bacterium]